MTNPVFDVWAPEDSGPAGWSRWAKPILFHATTGVAGADGLLPRPEEATPWAPVADGTTALVVDLPGLRALRAGVALARAGWRPVPVLNGAPPPPGVKAVVDTGALVAALDEGAAALAGLVLPPSAPPAFLLDHDRVGRGGALPGEFDNRWVVLPQDLPSADWLVAHGVRAAVLVTPEGRPRDDLVHALERWRRAGVALWAVDPDAAFAPSSLVPKVPWGFRALCQAFLAHAGLRPNAAGAFGGVVPIPPPPGSGGYRGGFS